MARRKIATHKFETRAHRLRPFTVYSPLPQNATPPASPTPTPAHPHK
jgi:hypothetical protein